MTDITTYKKRLFEFYELYHDVQDTASGTTVTVTGKNPHADVIASSGHKLKRTRVYVNGIRATITEVAASGADTVITVSDTINSGDKVDIYLATTVGTLVNNTDTGKFPLVELQALQNYKTTSNTFDQPGCGTERLETIKFASDGEATMNLIRRGNDTFKNFIMARQNGKYLMIIARNTTDAANTVYEVISEARVTSYSRGTRAIDAKGGEVVDQIKFQYVPPVEIST